jgi:hypothetical protein
VVGFTFRQLPDKFYNWWFRIACAELLIDAVKVTA